MILFVWALGALALLFIGIVQLAWGLLRVLFFASVVLLFWALQVIAVLVAAAVNIRRQRHTA